MRVFLRYMRDYRGLWRVWIPLLVLTAIVPPLTLTLPLVDRQIIDSAILSKRLAVIPGLLVLYCLLWLGAVVAQSAGGLLSTYSGELLTVRLRHRLFVHFEALSLAFSQREHSGQTLSVFLNDVPAAVGLFGGTLSAALGSLIALGAGVILMFALSAQLALAAAVAAPLVALLVALATRPLRPMARRVQEKAAELTERLQESLTGIRELVSFGQERPQELNFIRILQDLLRLRMRLAMIDTGMGVGQSLLSLSATLAVFGFGGYLVIEGKTTLGTVVAMRLIFGQVFAPASQIFGLATGVQKALGAADRIYGFLDETPLVEDTGEMELPQHGQREVVFDDVRFAYEAGREVLHGVSFTGGHGETVALVGPSGAGKSTVVSLLARFYDPSAGRILIDGVEIRDLSLHALRDEIAMVFQNTFLFAASIRENIALGWPEASEEEIIAAARAANTWEFIQRLPDGLDTQVGERGVRLSEGQRQRLAIARAFLRDPSILVLDEPTSALDAQSEALLQEALDAVAAGRTTFVIAHRLATILRADRILVLDGGRIVEQGTHLELLRSQGLYRQLFDLQFSSESVKLEPERPTVEVT